MKKYLIIFIAMLILECSRSDQPYFLPADATNIIDRGNGWTEFTLNENRFLFYFYTTHGHSAWSAITIIPEKE